MAEPIIGIDLGTSNSVVAIVEDDGVARVIPNRTGHRMTPSVVGFEPHGAFAVGTPAKKLALRAPNDVAFATKRFLGLRWSQQLAAKAQAHIPYRLVAGATGDIRATLAGRTVPLTQLSGMVLTELRLDAQAYLGQPISRAVITVPANFDDGQRKATKEAAQIAGLDLVRMINEPTAAALAYGLAKGFTGRALVFDLGGGTFDVSILEIQDGVFEVKATGGHPHLGGEDFDHRIAEWMLSQLPDSAREAVARDALSRQRLKVAAEQAKTELSAADQAEIHVAELGDSRRVDGLVEIKATLSRSVFESLCQAPAKQTIQVCEEVLAQAKVERGSIDALLLVGGMTRVPMVRRMVTEFFAKEPVGGVDPDEVVALGAAVQASQLAGAGGSSLLLDVASHSLGVGFMGSHVRCLIRKNSSVPTTAREIFLPGRAGQREAVIPIYQGEASTVDECVKLGEIRLKDLQSKVRTDSPIEVIFQLAADGTLSVQAMHPAAEQTSSLVIESRTSLPTAELAQLIKAQASAFADRLKEDTVRAPGRLSALMDDAEAFGKLLEKLGSETAGADMAQVLAPLQGALAEATSALEGDDPVAVAAAIRRLVRLMRGRK